MRILVADDQIEITLLLQAALGEAGYEVDAVENGRAALLAARMNGYDAIVLDVMMSEMDGLTALAAMRAENISTPVMILSGQAEVGDRLRGFKHGADDYMGKPFATAEVVALVKSLTRRKTLCAGGTAQVHDLVLDLATGRVMRARRTIELTPRERALLVMLMSAPGEAFSREALRKMLMANGLESGANVVAVNIARLRRKVDDGHPLKLLESVRGGYRLRADW